MRRSASYRTGHKRLSGDENRARVDGVGNDALAQGHDVDRVDAWHEWEGGDADDVDQTPTRSPETDGGDDQHKTP